MQAIINPSKEISYTKLPNFYPPMLLEVSKLKIHTSFVKRSTNCDPKTFFSLQMVQLCLKHNPKERASVADLLKFPIDMVIPINK